MSIPKTKAERVDRQQDRVVEDSFPASDPPANSGIIGPQGKHPHAGKRPGSHAGREDAPPMGAPTHNRPTTETAHRWEDQQ